MMQLIDDWKQSWKLWSVQLGTIGMAIQTAFLTWGDLPITMWNMMPDAVQNIIPERLAFLLPVVFFAAGGIARLIKQPKLEKTDGE
jgi:hypothetical protein